MSLPRWRKLPAAAAILGLCLGAATLARWRLGGVPTSSSLRISLPCLDRGGERGHWGKPHCEGESRIEGSAASMHFNAAGIRDKDYPARALPGTLRILVTGSSNVMGVGLPEESSLPRLLEGELRAAGYRVEVINAGMVGYCTIQTAYRFRELLERYAPGLVLHQLPQGTCPLFDGAWSDRVVEVDGIPARIDRTPFPFAPASVNGFLFSHPSLLFTWYTVADQLKKAAFSWRVNFAPRGEGQVETLLRPSVRYLSALKREAARSHAELVLFSFPTDTALQYIPSQMYFPLAWALSGLILPFPHVSSDDIFRKLRQEGFPFLEAHFDQRRYQIAGDQHLSAEGAAQFAREIAAELKGSKFLPANPVSRAGKTPRPR